MTLIDRLNAIAKRDLDDRTISPGEADDLLSVIEAAQAIDEWLWAARAHRVYPEGTADDLLPRPARTIDRLHDALAEIADPLQVSLSHESTGTADK